MWLIMNKNLSALSHALITFYNKQIFLKYGLTIILWLNALFPINLKQQQIPVLPYTRLLMKQFIARHMKTTYCGMSCF